MDPIITGGLISGVGNLLGSVFGLGQQKAANKANMELAEYQYSRALDMWNKQNEYNLPANQMQRLSSAGLNPNLVYGNGTVQGLTSAPAPEYKAPHIGAYTNFGSLGAEQALTTITNMRLADANINKTNAETQTILSRMPLNKLDITSRELDIARQQMENAKSEVERDIWKELYQQKLSALRSETILNYAKEGTEYAHQDLYRSQIPLNEAQNSESDARRGLINAQTITEKAKPGLMSAQSSYYRASAAYQSAMAEGQIYNNSFLSEVISEGLNPILSSIGVSDSQRQKLSAELLKIYAETNGQVTENQIRQILINSGVDPRNHSALGSAL